MADTPDGAAGIPLAEMIQTLRRELSTSMAAARNEQLRFRVDDVDLELQVTVTREGEGGGRVRFWVIELDGGGKVSRSDVHTFRLTLKPVTPNGAPEAVVGPIRRRAPVPSRRPVSRPVSRPKPRRAPTRSGAKRQR